MFKTLFCASLALSLAVSTPIAASDAKNGSSLYKMHCARCHGTDGKSRMAGAPDLDRPGSLMQSDSSLLPRIQSGQKACPGYRGILSEQAIFDVIAYIRTLGI